MASRALGAFLALAAAAAFVVSIATSAWWAGAPIVEGKTIEAKYVHAGPLGITGCNVGGDNSCEAVATSSTVQLVGYGALGATAVATLFLLILLVAAWRVSDNRRGFSTASLLVTLLAAGAGGALLALGPGIEASQRVEVPYGYGVFVFGGGVLASMLASAVTRRIEREPLRLKSSRRASRPSPKHAPQPASPQPARDVREVLREQQQDMLRPSAPDLPGAPAPQLRPLYEAEGAGIVPVPHARPLPMRGPTPVPRDALNDLIANLPIGPASSPSPSGPASPFTAVPPPPSVLPPLAAAPPLPQPPPRTKPPSMPPPRTKPPSMPPRANRPSDPPQPTHHTPPGEALRVKAPAPPRSVVPPPGPRSKIETHQRPMTDLATPPPAEPRPVRGSKPAIAAPARKPPIAVAPPRSPTLATAVPPMPTTDSQPVVGRAITEDDDPPPLSLKPPADAKPPKRRSDTEMRTGKNRIREATDVGLAAAPDPTDEVAADAAKSPAEHTTETPVVPDVPRPPGEQTAQTLMAPEPKRRDPEDLMRTIEQGSNVPLAGTERPQTATPIPTVDAERATHVPISTAPTSLPPPKQLDAAPSGPSPACPQCESPMSWVDEHLRFYCRSCRMYF